MTDLLLSLRLPAEAVRLRRRDRAKERSLFKPVSRRSPAVGSAEDLSFMYSRSFLDLDGHGWQVMWMDPAAQ